MLYNLYHMFVSAVIIFRTTILVQELMKLTLLNLPRYIENKNPSLNTQKYGRIFGHNKRSLFITDSSRNIAGLRICTRYSVYILSQSFLL